MMSLAVCVTVRVRINWGHLHHQVHHLQIVVGVLHQQQRDFSIRRKDSLPSRAPQKQHGYNYLLQKEGLMFWGTSKSTRILEDVDDSLNSFVRNSALKNLKKKKSMKSYLRISKIGKLESFDILKSL